jgi:hypothetical protein
VSPLQRALEQAPPPAEQSQGDIDRASRGGEFSRSGSCAACGLAVALHYDMSNRFVGCIGAARRVADRTRLYELPVVLTLADMAALLDRSERSIRDELRDGVFPIAHLVDAVEPLWNRKDVLAWLSKRTWEPMEVTRERFRTKRREAGAAAGEAR